MTTGVELTNDLAALRDSLLTLEHDTLPRNVREAVNSARQKLDSLPMASNRAGPEPVLEAITSIYQSLGLPFELSDVLRDILNKIIEITKAERGFILRTNNKANESQIQFAHNIDPDTLDSDEFRPGQRLINSVLINGEGASITNKIIDGRVSEQKINAPAEIYSALCVPMRWQGETIGVVYMDRVTDSGTFSPEDIAFVSAFASQAGTAIQNERFIEEIRQANLARTKFVSVVTHELRVPLTSIKGYTDLLRHGVVGQVSDQQLNFLNVVRSNVDRMSALISDLSDISRIETGRLHLNQQAVSLQTKINEISEIYRADIAAKKQFLEADIAQDLPDVFADPERTAQVLKIFISNAHLYTPENGGIRIQACDQDRDILVQVSDDGIGISSEDRENIFTQFYRSEDPAVREQPGWGLGLTVAQHLIEGMQGKIGVESIPGKGSTFWFMLPKYHPKASE